MSPETQRALDAARSAGRELIAIRASRKAVYALADDLEAAGAALIEAVAPQKPPGVRQGHRNPVLAHTGH